jgi:radical SAM protein with 4Fe4S-binding SPASM domain
MDINPHSVVWEYTLECDSRCLHCGSNALNCRKDELSSIEAKNLVREISELGFKRIFLSGGEPTLRKDWYETALEIKKYGLEMGLISNALAWNTATIDKLADLNIFSIGFSVDGEEKIHDYLRGVNGSHKKVFSTIKELKKRNQTICAVTSVNKLNLQDLPQIRNRLIVYEVDAWQIQMASPMGRMKKHMNIVLDNQDYYELAKFAAETRAKVGMNVVVGDCMGYFGKLEKKLREAKWNGCAAGIYGLGIRANGDVVGCLSMWKSGYKEGNIREKSLREIWENPEGFSYNRNFSLENLKGQCTSCRYGSRCRGGCNSQSIAFFNEFNHAPYCLFQIEKEKRY